TNITITAGTNEITISATDTDTQYLGNNLGGGAQVFKNITGTNPKTFNFRTLVAGTNVTITTNENDEIVISATYPAYDGTNVDCDPPVSGNGAAGVYKDTVGTTHRFRKIHGTKLVKVIEQDNCIIIVGKEPYFIDAPCATGEGSIFYDRIWVDDGSGDAYGELRYRFKKIKAGTNVTVTDNGCDIIISATGTDTQYLGNNLGSGAQVFKNITGTNPKTFNFRTIRGINGISVWTNYDEDVIYVSGNELQVHAAYGNLTGTFSIEDMANTEIPGYQWGLPNWRVAPITVYKSRQMFHFGGSEGSFEPPPGGWIAPYYENAPRLPTVLYAAESTAPVPYNIQGEGTQYYRTVRIKAYAIPLLRILGSPEHWQNPAGYPDDSNSGLERSGDHTTRIQFFSSPTIEFRVTQHPDYPHGAKVWANLLVSYDGTNVDCNPPVSGNGVAGVYKDTVGTTHRFRKLHGIKLVKVIEQDNCILIVGKEPVFLDAPCATGEGSILYDRVWVDDSSGDAYGELQYRFKKIKAGTNVTVTDNGCDIIISATDTDTQYLGNNLGSGAQVFKNLTGTNPKTFNFRTLVAGTNV
ncbi:MAG: hypothetical protein D6750_04400, partial [Bacteroidetes bacterium]